jgi:hypothetical protein
MNGMNIGRLALRPSRRSWMTWPISCTSSRATKPTANCQPQSTAYAAIETNIVPVLASSLIFGSNSRIALSLAKKATIAAPTGPTARLNRDGGRGSSGGSCGGGP